LTEYTDAVPIWPAPGGRPGSKWWLVAKDGHPRTQVLTVHCGDEPALPVFSGEGEAEMFVWLGGTFEDGWRATKTSARELGSILCGPGASVKRVALDPLPGMICLVSVARERFLDRIVPPGKSTSVDAVK